MASHRSNPVSRTAAKALSLAAVALAAFGTADAVAAPVQAKQADSFVESIGVNVHLTYSNSPYNNFPKLNQALQDLGVRYIRDGVGLGRPDVYSRYRALAAEGIHLDMIVGDPLQRYGIGTLSQQLNMIESEFPEAVATLEGPNEFDEQGDPNWVEDLRNYQRSFWESVQQRPALASKPVLGPSLVYEDSRAELGSVSQWTDQGNMHPYPGGQMPDLESHTNSELNLASTNTGSKPVEATETGYQNAVNNTQAGNRPVSEKATGIYTPRLFLDNYRRGIVRTYDYEMLDVEADPALTNEGLHFGLLKNDWTPKPAYTALQRLINLTEDPGPTFSPEPLDYSVQNAPSSLRQVLLERRDGTYDLVLWNAVSVWNTQSLTELNPSSPSVNVKFEAPIKGVKVFRPNESANAISSASNVSNLPVSLSPSVTVIEVEPAQLQVPVPSGPEALVGNPAPVSSPSEAPSGATEKSNGSHAGQNTGSAGEKKSPVSSGDTAEADSPSKPSAGSKKRSVRAKLRVIRWRVQGGCTTGCPLRGAELARARRLLGTEAAEDGAAVRRDAAWLKQRQDMLAKRGPLEGGQLLRYLTIKLVLKTAGGGHQE
jgi:hypothetical protein